MDERHPITRMTSGREVDRLIARVRYGVLTVAEALARCDELTKAERAELRAALAEYED